MALEIETGDLSNPNAETYSDIAFVDAYFADRGAPTAWTTLDTASKEAAIRYATLFFESTYIFKGCLQDRTQPLSFPRTEFIGDGYRVYCGEGVIPLAIKQAIAELALRQATEDLFYIDDVQDSRVNSESVDGHTISFESKSMSYGKGKHFPVVTRLISPYLALGGLQIKVERG